MGVFDKLKNVFFEEEYIEVEEPVKKVKKEKPTIAKKIDLPEMPKLREEKTAREKEIEEEVVERVEKKEIESVNRKRDNDFKFPMTFEDDDFTVDEYRKKPELKEEKKTRKTVEKPIYNSYNTDSVASNNEYSNNAYKNTSYGSKKEEVKTNFSSAGLYEGGDYKKEQKVFRPTPIISPIYGVLDKNYKKEEIVQKKEVRLTSASSRKVDLDSVREKAYGDLASDITASMMEEEKEEPKESMTLEESLYDLTDSDQPVINSVTMGDAEEYFNDLGLEYNIDYKDHSKEKATGRRSEKKSQDDEEKITSSLDEEEDSLFDLIDSMYQEEEE